jgi:hypothetical protein
MVLKISSRCSTSRLLQNARLQAQARRLMGSGSADKKLRAVGPMQLAGKATIFLCMCRDKEAVLHHEKGDKRPPLMKHTTVLLTDSNEHLTNGSVLTCSHSLIISSKDSDVSKC